MLLGRIFTGIAASVALLSAAVSGQAAPGACSGDCWSHDPALIRRSSDGVYFRFNTGGRIGILKSNSISGPWVYQGSVVPAGSKIGIPGSNDLWAPDVQKVGDLYICYYSVSTFGSQQSAIGYATSPTMEAGSWTDYGTTGVSSKAGSAYNAIDGNLIQSGSSYLMNFGSFWGDIYQVAMNSAGTKASGSSKQIVYQPAGSHAVEGPYMFYRSGYYYIFWSEGICCGYDGTRPAPGAEYKIRVGRSASPSGPFVDKSGASCLSGGGTTVLASNGRVYGPGGQGVYADSSLGTILYYHYVDTTVGYADGQKKFGWNVLNWSGGWPSV
jgi:arabinan endo-1,5-alpha-L-arabinosidase